MWFVYYNNADLNIPRVYLLPEEFYDSVKQCYHGGSCQMFMRGHFTKQKIMAIDINSAYPASMVKFNFPVGPYYTVDFGGPVLFTG